MKRNLLLIAIVMFFATTLMAQQRGGFMIQPEQIQKELSLNADQTAKYKTLSDALMAEMTKMRDSGSFDRDKMTELRDKMNAELKKVFTEDQYKKYTEMVEKARAERQRQ